MATIADKFEKVLEAVPFQSAQVPVLSNVEPTPTVDASTLKQRLSQQITGSVRWREISQRLSDEGIEQIVEIGPGTVLTGLIRRTYSHLVLENISSAEDLPI